MLKQLHAAFKANRVTHIIKADVKALFLSIPQQDCLNKLKNFLDCYYTKDLIEEFGIERDFLNKSIEYLVMKPTVQIADNSYHQIKGVLTSSNLIGSTSSFTNI